MTGNIHSSRRGISLRGGYTLLETSVALVAAGFLIAGLATAMAISSAAINDASSAQPQNIDAAAAMDRMSSDLRHATGFTERTATAATFTVPDRDGDKQPETIRYSWSGNSGDAVSIEHNGSPPAIVLSNARQFSFSWLPRNVAGTGFAKGFLGLSYDGFSERKVGGLFEVSWITLETPTGTSSGDLLITAVATNNNAGTFSVPAGWTTLVTQTNKRVTLLVAWRTATAAEPASHTFVWSEPKTAYGWMMRFTGQHPTKPIHAVAVTAGSSQSSSPPAPSVTTSVADTLILRIGAFDRARITVDNPGLPGNDAITMDHTWFRVSGGAGYRKQPIPSPTGTAEFSLTNDDDWITATIAVAPAE